MQGRKDKTLVEILDRIKALEGKIDRISLNGGFSTPALTSGLSHLPSLPVALSPDLTGTHPTTPFRNSRQRKRSIRARSSIDTSRPFMRCSIGRSFGICSRVSTQSRRGSPGLWISPTRLSCLARAVREIYLPTRSRRSTPICMGSPPSALGSLPVTVATLNWDTMKQLCKAYFDNFNFIYPILDRQSFISETMMSVLNNGFDDEMPSTIAFLVFALGEVAIAGCRGFPIHVHNGSPSGFRGGKEDQPPGLVLFNEARKRMGFHLSQCSLENVQMFALARQASAAENLWWQL